jgi:hypothetical protein
MLKDIKMIILFCIMYVKCHIEFWYLHKSCTITIFGCFFLLFFFKTHLELPAIWEHLRTDKINVLYMFLILLLKNNAWIVLMLNIPALAVSLKTPMLIEFSDQKYLILSIMSWFSWKDEYDDIFNITFYLYNNKNTVFYCLYWYVFTVVLNTGLI